MMMLDEVPGSLAMMEGWLKEWVNLEMVILGLAAATEDTVEKSQLAEAVPLTPL